MARPPLKKPKHLAPGAEVALIAPSSPFKTENFAVARQNFELHHKVKTSIDPSVTERNGYLAGSDERRFDELAAALLDPKVDAVFGIRGGYGCSRIYPALIKELKKQRSKLKPKIVHGYSDLTILLNGLHQDLGWVTFHGPMLFSHVFNPEKQTAEIEKRSFKEALFSKKNLSPISDLSTQTLHAGRASGRLHGGCLSLLTASLGTSYEFNADGGILLIEDTGERPYRLDRMLTQLLHAKKLDKVKGIVFGEMHDCPPIEGTQTYHETIKDLILPLAQNKNIPVVLDFPIGHGKLQCTIPIGIRAELDAKSKTLKFLEAACK